MAKYTIEVETDEFQEKALKRKAKLQEVSTEKVLSDIVNAIVEDDLNFLVEDALKTKLSKMPAGKALAILESMDE